jgi:D-glycero-D-manno-heptose 1,7-bisphosphate phosphatase
MARIGLFLDRDGVVNEDRDFVHRKEDFVFCDGIFDLVRTAISLNIAPVVVTNQSGIARGLFPEAAFHELTRWMLARFEAEGAPLARVYHCPYFPDAEVEAYRHPAHPWRKPAPGMLYAARDDLGLELARSAMIGDRWSDIGAGAAAGLAHLALVGSRADREAKPDHAPAVDRLADVRSAIEWLRRKVARHG